MSVIEITTVESVEALDQLVEEKFSESQASQKTTVFAVRFSFCRYWLPEQDSIELISIYQCRCELGKLQASAAISDNVEPVIELLNRNLTFQEVIDSLSLSCIDLTAPQKLQTVAIPKPWGQEIWYTGIEERGVASIKVGENTIELPYYLLLAKQKLLGKNNDNVTLLKILDPLPDPVYGDLYFELHEEKQEVYVVTNIDSVAWPDGKGAIRFGFDKERVSEYSDEDEFKKAYLNSVRRYEVVRRDIDKRYDELRTKDNIPLDKPLPAAVVKEWSARLPKSLLESEVNAREAMNSFTHMMKLSLGDVIKVPLLTPHALQHGVRTVEFQTPVYERQILSFCQKVLTQDCWDTEEGLDKASVSQSAMSDLELISNDNGVLVERIVDFDDFEVFRLTLEGGKTFDRFPALGYQLLMSVDGEVKVGSELTLLSEEACFIAEIVNDKKMRNLRPASKSVCLMACPKTLSA